MAPVPGSEDEKMTGRITMSLLILVLISVALLNPGTQLSLWTGWSFAVLLAVHFVEFLLKSL